MAQSCIICSHPKRLEIDREVIQRHSLAKICRDFCLPYASLYEHSKHHVTRQLAQAFEKQSLIEGNKLMEIIDDLIIKAQTIFDRNYAKGADVTALKAIDSIRGTIDLLAKISYQLHQAKMAELELLREKNVNRSNNRNDELEENLKCLTVEELRLFQRLQNKILHQNKDVIRRDKPGDFIDPFHQLAGGRCYIR